MRSSFSAERFRASAFTAAIIAISFAGALLLYGHTRDYGFDYDDYHFIRPYRLAEVAGAFRGPWDTTGIEVPFYRPLTVAFFATRFELFGLNSAAHHLVSLLLFACPAALTGFVAWRMLEQPAGGVLAAALFIAHPAMPYAQVAWVTNQMHLLESLVVLCALLWWTLIRRRGVV